LDDGELRAASNATFTIVALNALVWTWLFHEGLFSSLIRNQHPRVALLFPIVGIAISIVLPVWLERVGRPKSALTLASSLLLGIVYLTVDVFLHAGV
jgi:hypothetical protein